MPPAEPGYGPRGYPQQPGGYPVEVPNPQQAFYQPPQQGYVAPQVCPQTDGQPLSPDYSWQQSGGYPYPQPPYQDPRSYMEPVRPIPHPFHSQRSGLLTVLVCGRPLPRPLMRNTKGYVSTARARQLVCCTARIDRVTRN
jgi:hypothetical protein